MRQTSVVINNYNMCSSTPTSRFSETMLATIGPIGRTLISAMDLKLRCSANGCECANFIAAKERLRSCDGCAHSWITHLFEKLLRDETLSIFDVCSLALYGTHALPIRLKIVIERLLGTLQPEEIDKILRSFGWTPPDLARGYMIQEPRGGLLTRWSMLPREEEILILQQFLRFSPTRSLSFSLLRDDFQFNISQHQLQLQQQQQQQQLQLPSPTNVIEATTKIKTENSALNLSSSVHSRSRSTAIAATPVPPPPVSPHLRHHHHHHNHHHNNHHRNHHRSPRGGQQHSSSDNDDDADHDEPESQPPVDLSFNPNSKSSPGSGNSTHHNSTSHVSNNNNNTSSSGNSISKTPEDHHHIHVPHSEVQVQHRLSRERSLHEKPPAPDGVKSNSGGSTGQAHHRQQQHWSPITSNPSQLVNPATGKRRVQCSVCLKTFCDKGALKIHFSAVHLREMHKCTVVGCNMMFSSRRSRNRHSANPNPKLHSPHLRRRISPHDGRSSNPMLPIPLLGPMIPSGFTNGVKLDEEDVSHHMDEMDSCPSPSFSSSSLTSEKSPLPEENRRDGARKRKLSNPVRLPSVPDDSNDDFCCYDDGTEVVPDEDQEDEKNHLERLESLPIFSNHSDSGSNDDSVGSPNSTNGDSIPIDKENPRRCITCGKEFQNHFGVKTHYQNVHLKLMHKCTVDGCNAAFPSKRSRDRHSANLNLHRKLLSTSDASNGSTDDQPSQMTLSQQQQLFSPRHSFNPFLVNNGTNSSATSLNQVTPPWNPFLPFPVFPNVFTTSTSTSTVPIMPSLASSGRLPQLPTSPLSTSSSSDCRFCSKSFDSTSLLLLHLETMHSNESMRCRKCSLIFFSRRKLDSHNCCNNGI